MLFRYSLALLFLQLIWPCLFPTQSKIMASIYYSYPRSSLVVGENSVVVELGRWWNKKKIVSLLITVLLELTQQTMNMHMLLPLMFHNLAKCEKNQWETIPIYLSVIKICIRQTWLITKEKWVSVSILTFLAFLTFSSRQLYHILLNNDVKNKPNATLMGFWILSYLILHQNK